MFSKDKFCRFKNKKYLCIRFFRDVPQSGLEYSSGGRVVAGSNPVIPTDFKAVAQFVAIAFFVCRAWQLTWW